MERIEKDDLYKQFLLLTKRFIPKTIITIAANLKRIIYYLILLIYSYFAVKLERILIKGKVLN